MAKEKSPVPPGAFMELNVDSIDEGKFRKDFERKIRRAMRELRAYEDETQDRTASVMITATVKLSRTKGTNDHFDIIHQVTSKTPTQQGLSIVKERGGRLLCQPIGAGEFDPDQQPLFDAQGRMIAGTDPETGETVEERAVVGTIARAAQA